ncbi:MAG: amidohydrolase family protein [Saprospiraceae bacterium]
MKYQNTLLFILLLTLSACSYSNYIVIKNVAVFDGDQVYEEMNFVFADSTIIDISNKNKTYKQATIIDGTGMTIIPPLLNAHVHVRDAQNLKEALDVGIFALMDQFTTDRRANYLRTFNDSTGYARYFSSNVGATVPGGHGTQYNVVIPTINDTLSPAQFVQDRIAANADYIKITQEHTMEKLSGAQLRGITTAAHQHGKVAIAHISTLTDGMEAVKEGVDGLAHLWYRQGAISSAADLGMMKQKKVFIIPTLSVIQKVIAQAEKMGAADQYLSFEEVLKELKKAYDNGVPILAGTDSPNYGMDFTVQLFDELELLSGAGLSNIDVLKSATTHIYTYFKLEGFGRLAKKEAASFSLIQGKPHLAIQDLKAPKRVWKAGLEISEGWN